MPGTLNSVKVTDEKAERKVEISSSDTWGKVFQYLNLFDVASLDRTSKAMHAASVAKQDLIWRQQFQLHFPELSDEMVQEPGKSWKEQFFFREYRQYRMNMPWFGEALDEQSKFFIRAFKSLATLQVLAEARKYSKFEITKKWEYVIKWCNQIGTPLHVELLNQVYQIVCKKTSAHSESYLMIVFNQVDLFQKYLLGKTYKDIPYGLGCAVAWGSYDCVKLLLQKYRFHRSELSDELEGAGIRGDSKLVEMLIDYGADASVVGFHSGFALLESVALGNNHVIQLLLDNKANVNVGDSLLHAIGGLKPRTVALLLEYKEVNIFQKTYGRDDTPRQHATVQWNGQNIDSWDCTASAGHEDPDRQKKMEIHDLVKQAIWREPRNRAREIGIVVNETYRSFFKFSLFQHHHNARAIAVRDAISHHPNEAMQIIQNQLDIFDGKKVEAIPELLAERWSSSTNLRNRPANVNSSGFYRMLLQFKKECETYGGEFKQESTANITHVLPCDRLKGRFL